MKQVLLFTLSIAIFCIASVSAQASDDVYDWKSCVGIKTNQEYVIIYLTGDDNWYVAHRVFDGEDNMEIRGAWDWPKDPMPTPKQAMRAVRVDKRRIVTSKPVDDCIDDGEIIKWVIFLKPTK